jgi:hypothetical protein
MINNLEKTRQSSIVTSLDTDNRNLVGGGEWTAAGQRISLGASSSVFLQEDEDGGGTRTGIPVDRRSPPA